MRTIEASGDARRRRELGVQTVCFEYLIDEREQPSEHSARKHDALRARRVVASGVELETQRQQFLGAIR